MALVGGATGRVGDPSGKSLERPELDPLTLEKNSASIADTVRRILGQNATEGKELIDSVIFLDCKKGREKEVSLVSHLLFPFPFVGHFDKFCSSKKIVQFKSDEYKLISLLCKLITPTTSENM